MVLGNIELMRDGDHIWARNMATGEVAQVEVDAVARIAERIFRRLF